MNGILLVDKPAGPTSFDVVRRLKFLSPTKKAGHTGTLDPMATGLLPICLGDATKIAAYVTEADKEYLGVVRLGVETDSYDATGKVIETRSIERVTLTAVEAAIASFQGEYWQTPPMFSAVKVDGTRLYELARRGAEIERKPRKVKIHRIECRGFEAATGDVTLFVHCTKGTYIRAIAQELGESLGVGGHLRELRRLATGPFRIEEALPLGTILELGRAGKQDELLRHLKSMRDALPELREVRVDEERLQKVTHGMALGGRDLGLCGAPQLADGERVRVISPSGALIAVGEYRAGAVRPTRVLRAAGS